MPKEQNLVDPMHTNAQAVEFQSNKNMSGGRDQARPFESGVVKGAGVGGKRKGRKGRSR